MQFSTLGSTAGDRTSSASSPASVTALARGLRFAAAGAAALSDEAAALLAAGFLAAAGLRAQQQCLSGHFSDDD